MTDSVSPLEQAAILLMSLESKDAAEVMKHLGPKQVQRLGVAMASLENVDRTGLQTTLENFFYQVENQTSLGIDSQDHIRKMLVEALGDEKAGSVIDRILLGANTKGLDTLKWMDPKGVADIIRHEHPQIQAIVLSYLDGDQAANVLALFDEKERLDLVMRIATLESIQPSALKELNDIMEKQFAGTSKGQSKSVGGLKTAADILNYLDTSAESTIMETLKERDADLGQKIQDLMFTFENLKSIDDKGMQALLREVQSETLILALKGADEELKEKIFHNMSKRAAEMLREDLENKGPVRLSEVEAAQREILTTAQRMSDAGEIMLGGKSGEQMI